MSSNEGPLGPQGTRKLQFTSDWFSHHIPNWSIWLKCLTKGQEVHALEIGSWEGKSALWISENILNYNPKSKLWCIDTWKGSEEPAHSVMKEGVYERFLSNLLEHIHSGQVLPLNGTSNKSLVSLYTLVLKGSSPEFDFVYVDGSHTSADVLSDMILSFYLLKIGGIMIVDDYQWNMYRDPRKTPKLGIDCFLTSFAGRYNLIAKGSQVVLYKTEIQEELLNAK